MRISGNKYAEIVVSHQRVNQYVKNIALFVLLLYYTHVQTSLSSAARNSEKIIFDAIIDAMMEEN